MIIIQRVRNDGPDWDILILDTDNPVTDDEREFIHRLETATEEYLDFTNPSPMCDILTGHNEEAFRRLFVVPPVAGKIEKIITIYF